MSDRRNATALPLAEAPPIEEIARQFQITRERRHRSAEAEGEYQKWRRLLLAANGVADRKPVVVETRRKPVVVERRARNGA